MGEVASGEIGNFYENNKSLLEKPDTDENIKAFVQKETKYFGDEKNFMARFIGTRMSEQTRFDYVKKERDESTQ